jgi:hypothetical protein
MESKQSDHNKRLITLSSFNCNLEGLNPETTNCSGMQNKKVAVTVKTINKQIQAFYVNSLKVN